MSFTTIPALNLPTKERLYLQNLTHAIQDILEPHIRAIYLFGSASYGAYEPGTSDLDVAIVITTSLPTSTYQLLASKVNHAAIPCPAMKLELVIYTADTTQNLTRVPRFEMNLNTGVGVADHVSFNPEAEADHWFLLDLAVGRELGVALVGPAPRYAMGEVKKEWITDALGKSLRWWGDNEGANTSPDAVLNACRAWRWAETGVWGSKKQGAEWTLQCYKENDVIPIVRRALESRGNKAALDMADVSMVLKTVRMKLMERRL